MANSGHYNFTSVLFSAGQFFCGTLFFNHLVKHFNLRKANWHFHEAGHSKGAPDRIGSYVKRIADRLVAHGTDIHDLKTLYRCLTTLENKVEVFLVNEDEICSVDNILSQPCIPQLKLVKNTMQIHQVYWEISKPDNIFLRRLSCLSCQKDCQHFSLETHKYQPTQHVVSQLNHQDSQATRTQAIEHPIRRSRFVLYSDDESGDESIAESLNRLTNQSHGVVSFESETESGDEQLSEDVDYMESICEQPSQAATSTELTNEQQSLDSGDEEQEPNDVMAKESGDEQESHQVTPIDSGHNEASQNVLPLESANPTPTFIENNFYDSNDSEKIFD